MSLDPKYAELPWIAHGQPDVYEAGELPEADQHVQTEMMDSTIMPKEIENIKLSVEEAHKRFSRCKVDSSHVDFSDSISGSGKVGYAVDTEEYDLLSSDYRDNESLIRRFQRLQIEVQQLIEDSSTVKSQLEGDSKQLISPAELSLLAGSLIERLHELQLKNTFDPHFSESGRATDVYGRILKQIDEFRPEKPNNRKVDESSHLVYEIYDRGSCTDSADIDKLADIDRRIQRIEALLGQPDPTRLSALTAYTSQPGLLEACSRLAARSSLFQPGHLDMIEARLSNLQARLQSVTEKREAIADLDTQNKIAELYELVKKWTAVADSLPLIVERLTVLKDLHDEASQFSQALSALESSQKAVEENLKTYTKLLQDVQNNIGQNMQTVRDNFVSLECRLSQIKK